MTTEYVLTRPGHYGREYIGDGPFPSLDEAAEAVIGIGEFKCREWHTGRDRTRDVEQRLTRIEAEIFAETQAHQALVQAERGR
jgi:hypothetical protein